MQQEMAQRRQRAGISRQDSRLSVKSLIESIEKSSSHVIQRPQKNNINHKSKKTQINLNIFLIYLNRRLSQMVKQVTHTVHHPV